MREPPDADGGITREATASVSGALTLLVIGQAATSIHDLPDAGAIVLGRAPTCDVVIEDDTVSRSHATLHLGATMQLEDTGSVNGTRIRDAAAAPGTRIPIALDEPFALGSVTLIVQRRTTAVRSRRLWSHGYFEGRLEDECARAARFGQTFALIHVALERDLPADVVRDALSSVLHAADVLGLYGPGEYEILLLGGRRRTEADALAAQIDAALVARGARPHLGVAHYPGDGRGPDALSCLARERVRGGTPADRPEPVLRSDRMREIYEILGRIAGGDISVLLLGETGVGKEIVAEAVHRLSPRAARPFLRLNCAALSETLLESELFGHEKGSFTGAMFTKPGLLETAAGGTVFLDEIGELPMSAQVKLLRVLEERKVLRVGGLTPGTIDVRFVAATNRDLEAEIRRGAFREDLFYRLNGFSVTIPPLRERVTEIEPLARYFVAEFCRRNARYPEPEISAVALEWLVRYRWPGNIRELRNLIERAVLLCTGGAITPHHLPLDKLETSFGPRPEPPGEPAPPPPAPQPSELDAERARITAALEDCGGNQTRAAVLLGISRRTLVNRLDAYGLVRPRKSLRSTPGAGSDDPADD
jgi:two-component system, NtrC family, response regulator AtoC